MRGGRCRHGVGHSHRIAKLFYAIKIPFGLAFPKLISLDQNHFVAFGVIDQLIGEVVQHEQAKTTGTDTQILANFDVLRRIIG